MEARSMEKKTKQAAEGEVRIVELPAMRVASTLGFGPHPEDQAVERIMRFARTIGLLPGGRGYRTFGFDNPSPSPGSPNYGYECWLVVGADVTAEPPIEIKEIPQSKYAVLRCVGLETIGARWRALSAWIDGSPYRRPRGCGRCLEEPLSPGERDTAKWVFDLYAEIVG
jgi:effector-binding domain-containing protein